jgi:hypothetical protein
VACFVPLTFFQRNTCGEAGENECEATFTTGRWNSDLIIPDFICFSMCKQLLGVYNEVVNSANIRVVWANFWQSLE